jgi:hypothetical protein
MVSGTTLASNGWDVVVSSSRAPSLALPAATQWQVAAESLIRTAYFAGAQRDRTGIWHQASQVFLVLSDRQLQHPPIRLTSRDPRFPSDAAVWRARRDDPGLAVTFALYFGNGPIFLGGGQRATTLHLAGGALTPIFGWNTSSWYVVSERALSRLPVHGLGTLALLRAAPGVFLVH